MEAAFWHSISQIADLRGGLFHALIGQGRLDSTRVVKDTKHLSFLLEYDVELLELIK